MMNTRTVIQELAGRIGALKRCEENGNTEWSARHQAAIDDILDSLPSGGGIDNGTKLDLDASSEEKIVLIADYHHMNDGGYYDGWTEHRITVTPAFDGISLAISGRNRNDIKAYLHDTYRHALTKSATQEQVTA